MNDLIMYTVLFGVFFLLPLAAVLALGGFFSRQTGQVILVRQPRFVPIILLAATIWGGVVESPWWFLSVPFILVGTCCAAPNFNLANGMLAYLSMIAGVILSRFHEPSGLAVTFGVMASYYGSAVEMRVFARPAS